MWDLNRTDDSSVSSDDEPGLPVNEMAQDDAGNPHWTDDEPVVLVCDKAFRLQRLASKSSMASVTTYNFPIRPTAATLEDGKRTPVVFNNLRARGVTGFQNRDDAQGFYLAGIAWSTLIIVLDSLLLWGFTTDTQVKAVGWHSTLAAVGQDGLALQIIEEESKWGLALSSTMVGLSLFGMLGQAVNVMYYHFRRWPLTAFVSFTQLLGFALATAILGTHLFYPHSDVVQRNTKLGIAISDLVARAILISIRLGVAVEYLVRSIAVPEP